MAANSTDEDSRQQKPQAQAGPKLGRRGDPRMHQAVAARLANPTLSLTEALEKGGFDVTGSGGDGINLSQRKNQLSRRLRLVRQSGVNTEGGAASLRRKAAEGFSSSNINSPKDENDDEATPPSPLASSPTITKDETQAETSSADSYAAQRALISAFISGLPDPKRDAVTSLLSCNSGALRQLDPALMSSLSQAQRLQIQDSVLNSPSRDVDSSANGNVLSYLQALQKQGARPGLNKPFSVDVGSPATSGNASDPFPGALNIADLHAILGAKRTHNSSSHAGVDRGPFEMNQEALQALFARSGADKEAAMSAVAVGGARSALDQHQQGDREDLYKSFLRSQKSFNDYLVKLHYEKSAEALRSQAQNQLLASHLSSRAAAAQRPPVLSSGAIAAAAAAAAAGGPHSTADEIQRLIRDNSSQQQKAIEQKRAKEAEEEAEREKAAAAEAKRQVEEVQTKAILSNYKVENASLLQRLMSQVGIPPDDLLQHSQCYVEMASRAVEQEMERVLQLRKEVLGEDVTFVAPWKEPNSDDERASPPAAAAAAATRKSKRGDEEGANSAKKRRPRRKHSHDDGRLAGSADSRFSDHRPKPKEHKCYYNGRHIHSLSRKCGHLAVIHRPDDGSEPHIDFVVGNRVECYKDAPLEELRKNSGETRWPSRYQCEEINCKDHGEDEKKCDADCSSFCQNVKEPVEYPIDVLDEWDASIVDLAGDPGLLNIMDLHQKSPT